MKNMDDNQDKKDDKRIYLTGIISVLIIFGLWLLTFFVLKGVDLEELEKVIAEDEKASYHENEVYKVHNKYSRFERIYRAAQKIMNPWDYKFPTKIRSILSFYSLINLNSSLNQ